jgi:hypothetical protein
LQHFKIASLFILEQSELGITGVSCFKYNSALLFTRQHTAFEIIALLLFRDLFLFKFQNRILSYSCSSTNSAFTIKLCNIQRFEIIAFTIVRDLFYLSSKIAFETVFLFKYKQCVYCFTRQHTAFEIIAITVISLSSCFKFQNCI